MKSFRTELENPVVEKDIIELEQKIHEFKTGKLDEESFRSLRLARGVYGQRQQGVQMVRIKIPLGIIEPNQLRRIAAISDKYSNGHAHLTTRQDIQIHHVSLDDTPQLWAELEEDDITLREACGNTVRNITASPYAGVDQDEVFDITPYGWALFRFFLRNPVGEDMGRKFKIALSAGEKDRARVYMHDLGLIPVLENGEKGFRVFLGGGLGAQPALSILAREFLPVNELLPYAEAVVRFFDQYGERNKRNKARFKFLIKELGDEDVLKEITHIFNKIKGNDYLFEPNPDYINRTIESKEVIAQSGFETWLQTNVTSQKQADYYAVVLKIKNGNLTSDELRRLAEITEQFSPEPARITIEQNLVLRSVHTSNLVGLFNALNKLGFAGIGANRINDITACPGTQTCNLGITATYGAAQVLEDHLEQLYKPLILKHEILIKMSGCMNSCGQHVIADIGFHGSSIRTKDGVLPALQILLGGANKGGGKAQLADKVIKIPSKRVVAALDILLEDFQDNSDEHRSFNAYYNTFGKRYFYDLLKPLSVVDNVTDDEFLDWGADTRFQKAIGVGECAGVKIDLVKTLLYEAYDKIERAQFYLDEGQFSDSIYAAYSAVVESAKAYLVKKGEKTNSKVSVVNGFETYYSNIKSRFLEERFTDLINGLLNASPTIDSAKTSVELAERFHLAIDELSNEA